MVPVCDNDGWMDTDINCKKLLSLINKATALKSE